MESHLQRLSQKGLDKSFGMRLQKHQTKQEKQLQIPKKLLMLNQLKQEIHIRTWVLMILGMLLLVQIMLVTIQQQEKLITPKMVLRQYYQQEQTNESSITKDIRIRTNITKSTITTLCCCSWQSWWWRCLISYNIYFYQM